MLIQAQVEARQRNYEIQRLRDIEEARRLHQLSLAGKFKLNTVEDMGYANFLGDAENLNMVAEKQLHVKYANGLAANNSPNASSITKKGVYIIKELVCKDLGPENVEEK